MIYGLYHQFDLHPEKFVNGKQQVSGLKFFFWEQSFGRIAGTNVYENDHSFFYLFHCLLLLILPYSFIIIKSVWDSIKQFSFFENQVSFLMTSVIVILIALSLSSYKIPHYTAVIFPFCAILMANTLLKHNSQKDEKFLGIYCKSLLVICLLLCGVSFYCFTPSLLSIFLWIVSIALGVLFIKEKNYIFTLASIGVLLGVLFYSHVVPNLHDHTVGKRFTNLVKENDLLDKEIYFVNRDSRAMEFYLQKRSQRLTWAEVLSHKEKEGALFYMEKTAVPAFQNDGLKVKNNYCLDVYDLNRVSAGFLNPKTRSKYVEQHCLVEFYNK